MGFLRQNGGRFSHRARTREFAQLTDEEAASAEGIYQDLLLDLDRPTRAPRPRKASMIGPRCEIGSKLRTVAATWYAAGPATLRRPKA